MLDESGNLLGYRGADTDITERKLAEEALRASEATYRSIFDATNDAILVQDMETGEIVDANAAFLERHGCTLDEARRRNVGDFSAGDPPYTQEDALRWLHKAASGQPQRFEWQSNERDGRRLWLDLTLKRATIAGKDRVLAISRDITVRKQAEEKLRETNQALQALIQASPLAIFTVDPQGNVETWNPAAERIFGWSEQEAVGRTNPIIPEGQENEFYANLDAVLHGNLLSEAETRRRRKDGSLIDVSLSTAAMRNAKGDIVGAMAIIADITERKRTEEELHKAREELENSVERQIERGHSYGLTFRELTILHLVATGKADKEIAYELGISPLTVHKHLGNILAKMGAASRTEAGVRALRDGLLN